MLVEFDPWSILRHDKGNWLESRPQCRKGARIFTFAVSWWYYTAKLLLLIKISNYEILGKRKKKFHGIIM